MKTSKSTVAINAQDLEALIDELMKSEPNQAKVKELTQKQGIPYHRDHFQQMNQVLMTMNDKNLVKELKEKESAL